MYTDFCFNYLSFYVFINSLQKKNKKLAIKCIYSSRKMCLVTFFCMLKGGDQYLALVARTKSLQVSESKFDHFIQLIKAKIQREFGLIRPSSLSSSSSNSSAEWVLLAHLQFGSIKVTFNVGCTLWSGQTGLLRILMSLLKVHCEVHTTSYWIQTSAGAGSVFCCIIRFRPLKTWAGLGRRGSLQTQSRRFPIINTDWLLVFAQFFNYVSSFLSFSFHFWR